MPRAGCNPCLFRDKKRFATPQFTGACGYNRPRAHQICMQISVMHGFKWPINSTRIVGPTHPALGTTHTGTAHRSSHTAEACRVGPRRHRHHAVPHRGHEHLARTHVVKKVVKNQACMIKYAGMNTLSAVLAASPMPARAATELTAVSWAIHTPHKARMVVEESLEHMRAHIL